MYNIPIPLNWLESDIVKYEQKPVQTGKILFYGHSMFTRWGQRKHTDRVLEEVLVGKNGEQVCLNHGFGTSTSEELLYYYDRLVRPYKPRVLVIMSWANDSMYGYSPERTMDNLAKLCHWARIDFPGIPIFFALPHPRRSYAAQPTSRETRREDVFCKMMQAFADTHEDVHLISMMDKPMFYETPEDVGNMLKVRKDIYEDNVHLNSKGYALFKDIFLEVLDEYL